MEPTEGVTLEHRACRLDVRKDFLMASLFAGLGSGKRGERGGWASLACLEESPLGEGAGGPLSVPPKP
jgi:hypothetical protein